MNLCMALVLKDTDSVLDPVALYALVTLVAIN